ncbi:hypothetical protein TRFO_13300 [Tritrichomonas foetus]|uniref:SP-RING-type domain-containing protein n=1 Tax=Tritrichomonas foetus TaxID=1144522 RepID=A0A1J4L2U4_9EUKA|nr:hypothetical protein TRFO_13300 [Tritrichomonas foetus]|eukprot:OHT16292.1 hypothetical protein TRFO_13300 [Tritrichomonas foetus]
MNDLLRNYDLISIMRNVAKIIFPKVYNKSTKKLCVLFDFFDIKFEIVLKNSMSLPEALHISLTSNHSSKKPPLLRNVRLNVPPGDLPQVVTPNSPPQNLSSSFPNLPLQALSTLSTIATLSTSPSAPNPGNDQSNDFHSLTSASISKRATLIAPSVFYRFHPDVEPSFVYDVLMPNNAKPFTAQPPLDINQPRFLLYAACVTPVSTSPVKFILNGKSVAHWTTDPRPLDVTDLLVPFGQQNWLIVESGNFVVPFTVIGVWASFFPIKEIVQEIEQKGCFEFKEVAAICPISGAQIEVPSRGLNCNHEECFDLLPYITACQAMTMWICPICNHSLPLCDLRIGVRPQFTPASPNLDIPTSWGQNQESGFDDGSTWWPM